jgi:nucleoside-triphosphatase THEP1
VSGRKRRERERKKQIKKMMKKKKLYQFFKNSNRNIIPNIINQIISFLQKKYKS